MPTKETLVEETLVEYNEQGRVRVDMYGNPIERHPEFYPYSFDMYVTYDHRKELGNDFKGAYTDRLFQWDTKKYNEARKKVFDNISQHFDDPPKQIEEFLRAYYDDDSIVIALICKGCNWANGFPVWYLGWITEAK